MAAEHRAKVDPAVGAVLRAADNVAAAGRARAAEATTTATAADSTRAHAAHGVLRFDHYRGNWRFD
jgi:hypothetical protein